MDLRTNVCLIFASLFYAASRGSSYDLHGFHACHSRRPVLGLGVDVPAVTLIWMVEVLEERRFDHIRKHKTFWIFNVWNKNKGIFCFWI